MARTSSLKVAQSLARPVPPTSTAPRPRPRFRKAAIWPRVTFELGQNFVAEHPVVRRAPNSREIGVWNVCEVGTSVNWWLALTITGSASIRPTSATRVSRLASLGRAVARAHHDGPAAEPAASTCVLSSSNSARMAWISSRSPGCISPSSNPIRRGSGHNTPQSSCKAWFRDGSGSCSRQTPATRSTSIEGPVPWPSSVPVTDYPSSSMAVRSSPSTGRKARSRTSVAGSTLRPAGRRTGGTSSPSPTATATDPGRALRNSTDGKPGRIGSCRPAVRRMFGLDGLRELRSSRHAAAGTAGGCDVHHTSRDGVRRVVLTSATKPRTGGGAGGMNEGPRVAHPAALRLSRRITLRSLIDA